MAGLINAGTFTNAQITNVVQTGFFAYRGTTAQTSLATGAAIICDVTLANVGGGYSTGTGIFTAPTTGKYLFTANVAYQALSGGLTTIAGADLIIAGTTYRLYAGRMGASGVNCGMNGGIIVPMTSGQTAQLKTFLSTGTVSLIGEQTTNFRYSFFSGLHVGG